MARTKAPLEKELKYLLKRQEYEKLIRVSRKRILTKIKQTNIYFDDSSLRLRKNKIGLRVRLENGKDCTLTLKEPSKLKSKKVPSLKVRHEWESRLPLSLAKELINGKVFIGSVNKKPISILRKRIPIKQLSKIRALGAIQTVRTLVQADKDTVLEIDKYTIFQKRFYELEVETQTPEKTDRLVRHLFSKHGISCRPITKSKLGRFLDLWKKANKK